jgi:GAF domain-containing protein
MPGRGVGLHALVVAENEALCLTEDEVEQHPDWRGFAESAGKHPPLRGLLAVPIVGEDGLNYGLLQASDKADGTDFGAEDERRLQCLADAAAVVSTRSGRCVRCVWESQRRPHASKPPRASW